MTGASWTTDAPFRETEAAIKAARSKGVLAVEMEAAALYAFARKAGARILCLAHVTNTMGRAGADFEKGEETAPRPRWPLLPRLPGYQTSPPRLTGIYWRCSRT